MLCRFANTFPIFVERFLQQGSGLNRRFREETITDLMVGHLLSAGWPKLIVDFPNEAKTGADLRLDFVNTTTGTYFCLFIQAKKLYANRGGWRVHSYRKLLYKTGSPPTFQSDVLCKHASGSAMYPLYAFYNQGGSCELARAEGARNVAGVNLADGFEIARRVTAAATAPSQTIVRQLGTLQPILFGLPDLFCPSLLMPFQPSAYLGPGPTPGPSFVLGISDGKPTLGFPLPPRPEDIRDRLASILSEIKSRVPGTGSDLTPVPPVTRIPVDVALRIARFTSGEPSFEEEVPYWRLTFIAQEPLPRFDEAR